MCHFFKTGKTRKKEEHFNLKYEILLLIIHTIAACLFAIVFAYQFLVERESAILKVFWLLLAILAGVLAFLSIVVALAKLSH